MDIKWNKCTGDVWCSLANLDLGHEHFNNLKGVYIIWSGKTVFRLGSGIIKDRLKEHRENPEISKYPDLYVTWAQVNANQMEGVEKFLADQLNPLVGDRFPGRTPIQVNFPW
ncbi:MAG: hypothetical protein L6437_10050 [Kiritimatiellae bacterium]|nr:hypothetical protein [Kiritimatiellia bacterium]